MEINKIERVTKIQRELPPKNEEESMLKKIKEQPNVRTFDEESTVDISDEGRELSKKLEEEK